MSNRIHVGTRKGLFTVERSGGGAWRITNSAFVGDPVPALLSDTRDGTLYAALNLGHFGSKLQRSRDQGKTWEEVGVPTYPEDPGETATRGDRPRGQGPQPQADLDPGGSRTRSPGCPVGGNHPRGALLVGEPGGVLGPRVLPVGPPRPQEVVRGRGRPSRHSLHLCGSPGQPAGAGGRLGGRCLADRKRRGHVGGTVPRHVRRLHAPRAAGGSGVPGSPSHRAEPVVAGTPSGASITTGCSGPPTAANAGRRCPR